MSEGTQAELIDALAKIMGEVKSVEKRGTNDFHRYKYATAADVMHKLQPLMAEHGIVVFQHEKTREMMMDGAALAIAYEFTIAHRSGAVWPEKPIHTGVAAAKTTKGSPDDKAANKCHTAARKYFLLALFQIPTGDYDDADADGDVPQNTTTTRQQSRPAPQQRPADDDVDPEAEARALAYMAGFRTRAMNCATPAELTALWNGDADARAKALSPHEVGQFAAEMRKLKEQMTETQREAA